MELNYVNQWNVSFVLIMLTNLLSRMVGLWIFRSIGFVLCGLLWILHPVAPGGNEVNQKTLFWTRLTGIAFILIGILT